MYTIRYTKKATKDILQLQHSEPIAFKKVKNFIDELKEHPKFGTGHPEPLKGMPEGRWSRTITKKHRLVYQVFEEEVVVLVLTSYGHYDDK